MHRITTDSLEVRRRVVPAGQYKPRNDAIDLFISNTQLHAQKPSNPASLFRNASKMLNGQKMRRTYGKIQVIGKNQIRIGFDFNETEVLACLNKRRKSMLRFYIPTAGVPVYMAQDALEKIRSLERKYLT